MLIESPHCGKSICHKVNAFIIIIYVDCVLPKRRTNKGIPWWRHQMETLSALLAICAGNSPVPGEFPAQRPVTRSFYVFFYLSLNKRLSKQPRGWWFETPSWSLWRHCNAAGFLWCVIYESSCRCYLGCFHAGYSTLWKCEFLWRSFHEQPFCSHENGIP